MDVTLYIQPFITSFLLCSFFIFALLRVFRHIHVSNVRVEKRHDSARARVSRFGGVACIFATFITLLFDSHLILTYSWWGIMLVSVAILIFGIMDDIVELSWQKQLLFQVLLGCIAFLFHIRLTSLKIPFHDAIFLDVGGVYMMISCLLTIAWILFVMNAINWSDGLDGICGGISCIAFATIFFVSLYPEVNQPPMAIYAISLVGASLAFLIFNFYPARIVAGTSGAWFFGFSLASLAIFSGTKIATAILVLIIPLIDALWVMFERFVSGTSLFQADMRHLHHRLQKIGWSTQKISLFYYGATMSIAAVALHINAYQKVLFLVVLFIAVALFFLWIQRVSKSLSLKP